jgi:integrase
LGTANSEETAGGRLTKRAIDAAKAGRKARWLWDGDVKGFGVRLHGSGVKSFVFQYRAGKGRAAPKRRYTIGTYGTLTLDKARNIARQLAGKAAGGSDPLADKRREALAQREARQRAKNAQRNTVAGLAVRFLDQHVKPHNRSAAEYERILNRYVLPAWGKRPVNEIRRADVVALLDGVVAGTGPGTAKPRRRKGQTAAPRSRDRRTMAHHVLAVIRKMFRWHQARDENFVTPVVAGMSPLVRPGERARDRILSDDELRAVWTALDATAYPFGPLVRFLLLTAQRREEAAQARWDEIDLEAGTWTIPAARYKTKRANVVPLSPAARDVLASLPRILPSAAGSDADAPAPGYVFTTTGNTPFSGFSKAKRTLDSASKTSDWTLHDLRRTARTLMVRASVRSDVAERVLGHVIGGVAGVYDRHDYVAEKRHALEALAAEIDRVLNPQPAKVVKLRRPSAGAPS